MCINFNKNNSQMLQQLDQQARQIVPMYSQAADLTVQTYQTSFQTASSIVGCANTRIQNSKSEALRIRTNFEKDLYTYVNTVTNTLLCHAEAYLLQGAEKPSEEQKRQVRLRVQKLFNKMLGDNLRQYLSQAQEYSSSMVVQGRRIINNNFLPMYIRIKATTMVCHELLAKMIEDQLVDMKMTYSVSKNKVTMLIKGNFDRDTIARQISTGMGNFKDLTVQVVQKGLQIQVDKQSLYDNYETFSLKLLEIIKEVRDKGAERIVSVRQSATELYQSVLQRIRQREITLKMQYNELRDNESVQLPVGENTTEQIEQA